MIHHCSCSTVRNIRKRKGKRAVAKNRVSWKVTNTAWPVISFVTLVIVAILFVGYGYQADGIWLPVSILCPFGGCFRFWSSVRRLTYRTCDHLCLRSYGWGSLVMTQPAVPVRTRRRRMWWRLVIPMTCDLHNGMAKRGGMVSVLILVSLSSVYFDTCVSEQHLFWYLCLWAAFVLILVSLSSVCFDTCVSEQRLCILSPLCAHGACARTLWVVVDPLTVLEKPLCRLVLFSCREHVSRACSLTTACCFTRYWLLLLSLSISLYVSLGCSIYYEPNSYYVSPSALKSDEKTAGVALLTGHRVCIGLSVWHTCCAGAAIILAVQFSMMSDCVSVF